MKRGAQMAGSQGRFLSPDPDNAGADPTNPQSWNGYGYVWNTPLSAIDPTGLYGSCPGSWGTVPNGDGTTSCAPPPWYAPTIWSLASGFPIGGPIGNPAPPTVIPVGPKVTRAPAGTSCGKTGLGGGVLVGYGGNFDAGLGIAGVTGTGSGGVGLFYGSGDGFSTGASATGGTAAYALGNVAAAPTQGGQPFSLGAYAGIGPSITVTNARSVQQIGGPFTAWTLNVGFGPVKGSLQLSYGGGIWEVSLGPPVPYAAPGFGGSISKVTTNTTTTKTGCGG